VPDYRSSRAFVAGIQQVPSQKTIWLPSYRLY